MSINLSGRSPRPYKVVLTATTTHEYVIDARTPEEAESIAEQYYAEGEDGSLITADIEASDVLPVEELEDVA